MLRNHNQAFPTIIDNFPKEDSGLRSHKPGMEHREWYAGMAMEALLSRGSKQQKSVIAKEAFEMADEMMKLCREIDVEYLKPDNTHSNGAKVIRTKLAPKKVPRKR